MVQMVLWFCEKICVVLDIDHDSATRIFVHFHDGCDFFSLFHSDIKFLTSWFCQLNRMLS